MSAFHLIRLRPPRHADTASVHVAWVLFLSFLGIPVAQRYRHRIMWWDWALAPAVGWRAVYLIQGGDDFTDRTPRRELDIFFGVALILM